MVRACAYRIKIIQKLEERRHKFYIIQQLQEAERCEAEAKNLRAYAQRMSAIEKDETETENPNQKSETKLVNEVNITLFEMTRCDKTRQNATNYDI